MTDRNGLSRTPVVELPPLYTLARANLANMLWFLLGLSLTGCAPHPDRSPEIGELRYQLLRLKQEVHDASLGDEAALRALPLRRERIESLLAGQVRSPDADDLQWALAKSFPAMGPADLELQWKAVRLHVDALLARRSDLIALAAACDTATKALQRLEYSSHELVNQLLHEQGEPRQIFAAMELARMAKSLTAYFVDIRTGEIRGTDGHHWGLERSWTILGMLLPALESGDEERGLRQISGPRSRAALAEVLAEHRQIVPLIGTILDSAPWMPAMHDSRESVDAGVERLIASTSNAERSTTP